MGKTSCAFAPGGDYMVTEPNLPPTYSQSWNISIQREVVPGTLLSASYLRTLVIHLQASESQNPAIFILESPTATGTVSSTVELCITG